MCNLTQRGGGFEELPKGPVSLKVRDLLWSGRVVDLDPRGQREPNETVSETDRVSARFEKDGVLEKSPKGRRTW